MVKENVDHVETKLKREFVAAGVLIILVFLVGIIYAVMDLFIPNNPDRQSLRIGIIAGAGGMILYSAAIYITDGILYYTEKKR